MIKEALYILIILAGIPAGIVLTKLCKEELQSWKRRFIYLAIISLILIPIIYLTSLQFKIPIIITLLFIIMTSITIICKTPKQFKKNFKKIKTPFQPKKK